MSFRIGPATAAETADLRRAVLRAGRTDLPLGDDPSAQHLGAYDDQAGVLVATGNIRPEGTEPGDWRIRGMATDPAYQGSGAGGLVLEELVALARAEGAERIWCHARTGARRFYERHGFEVFGEEWDEPPPLGPHVVMERHLPGR